MAFNINTLKIGYKNLAALIEYQDRNFQNTGTYKTIEPATDLAYIKNFESCAENCTPCEYTVKISLHYFTATAKCIEKDGTLSFRGYVRAKPGQHVGIDGHYEKCKSKGIYAQNRYLINTIGPCFKQENDYMFITSGTKKRLVIETLPSDVEIRINNTVFGTSSESHNTTTNNYGSLFISEPVIATNLVTLSKQGYESITFSIDWESYTYKATVVLYATPQ